MSDRSAYVRAHDDMVKAMSDPKFGPPTPLWDSLTDDEIPQASADALTSLRRVAVEMGAGSVSGVGSDDQGRITGVHHIVEMDEGWIGFIVTEGGEVLTAKAWDYTDCDSRVDEALYGY